MSKLYKWTGAMMLTACLAWAGMALAQGDGSGKSNSKSTLSSMDKSFVTKAAEGGLAEVELGKLAQEKGNSQEVKDFGQKMVEEHSAANDKLKEIADKLGVKVPDHVSAMQMAQKTKLKSYSGHHFDRAYMNDMVDDHKNDVAEFQKEADNGQNEDLKNFASETLPKLKEHLQLAEETHSKINTKAQK